MFIEKDEKWKKMTNMFESLGGIAENVYQKNIGNSRGIYSIDKTKESKIFVPEQLLIQIEDIDLYNGDLCLQQSSNHSAEVKDFFNFYQKQFSWGNGGKESVEKLEIGLKNIPEVFKRFLKHKGLIDINKRHVGSSWEKIILKHFIKARIIRHRRKNVLAPVWELVNHRVNSNPFQVLKDGVSTPKIKSNSGEITHKYSPSTPLERLINYGFVCEESKVFSLPFEIKNDKSTQFICKGKVIYDDNITIIKEENKIIIDGFPVGDSNVQSLPNAYWDELMRRINIKGIDKTFFQRIIELNKNIRNEAIDKINEIKNNYSANMLKEVLLIESKIINQKF